MRKQLRFWGIEISLSMDACMRAITIFIAVEPIAFVEQVLI